MHKACFLTVLTGLLLLFGLAPGCSGNNEVDDSAADIIEYIREAYGCSFAFSSEWQIEEPKERQGVLTLRVENKSRKSSYMVITLFPADLYSREETVHQAIDLLEMSLFALEEPIKHEDFSLSSGETIQLLRAQAGKKEKVEAVTAVIFGNRFSALVTLIAKEEFFELHQDYYRTLLESFTLQ